VLAPAAEGDPQPYAWDYWGVRGWTELSVRDTSFGLRQTGLVQFVGAPDALPREGLGGALYRVRARLKSGLASQDQRVACGGAWLNAAWARQGQAVSRDGLGSSNGNPDQCFALPSVRASSSGAAPLPEPAAALDAADFERALDQPLAGVPILGSERVEVREWLGRGDDWRTVLADVDPADVRFEVDPQEPTVKTAAWVRWWPQPHFYRSNPGDRHYVVERARGVFRFPGVDGFIPPAGAPIGSAPVDPNLDVVKKSKGPVMTLVDEFYKVGPGPSSSHTIGPMRITYDFYQRVMKLPPDTRLLPGHGEVSTLELEGMTNPFVQEIMRAARGT